MKKINNDCRLAHWASLLLLMACLGCNKVTLKETPTIASFYEIATDDVVNFSYLKSAINRAGLVEKFAGKGDFNFFAPTNDAFIAAGYKDTAAIRAADPEVLATVLNYHLTADTKNLEDLEQGYSDLPAENGGQLIFYKDAQKKMFVNGADVLSYNHTAANGKLHVINRLLSPPSGDIRQTIATNANLSYCVAAIEKAMAGGTDIETWLAKPGITFFAPLNTAFNAAGYANLNAVKNADPQVLADLLRYHILEGRRFTIDFGDTAIAAASGKKLYLVTPEAGTGLVNGIAITGGNANILTSNGLVHIVSKVLVAPTQNLLDYVIGSNLTLLEAAILRTADGSKDIAALLASDTEYTLLAPNNAAMNAAGYPTAAFIRTANPDELSAMLLFHIVPKRRFSLSFKTGSTASLTPLAGGKLTVSTVSGFNVGGPGNSTLAKGSPLDQLATNGVAQVINQVLKP